VTREEIRAEGLAEPISHFTDAVLAGGLLFVSGVVAVDGEGRLVGGDDVVAQARQDHAGVDAARQCVPTGPRQVDLSAIRS
jgi:enamine deaminase RidA (YjgF/YER057c/UK114 family)